MSKINLIMLVFLTVISFGYTTTEAQAGAYDQLVDISGGGEYIPPMPGEPTCDDALNDDPNALPCACVNDPNSAACAAAICATELNSLVRDRYNCDGTSGIKNPNNGKVNQPDPINNYNTPPQLPEQQIPKMQFKESDFPTFSWFNQLSWFEPMNIKTRFLRWFRPTEVIFRPFTNSITRPVPPNKEYPHVVFGKNANQNQKYISPYSKEVIEGILKNAGITHEITITSTYRDSANQARMMLDNLELRRLDYIFDKGMTEADAIYYAVMDEKKIYCSSGTATVGCKAIYVYAEALSSNFKNERNGVDKFIGNDEIRTSMTDLIEENRKKSIYVSQHMRNEENSNLNVIDISPNSFKSKDEHQAFIKAVEKAIEEGKITKNFITPNKNHKSYHLEIIQKR